MEILFDENEKHIQINDFFADGAEGYAAYRRELLEKYPGYEVDFCYHDREAPAAFMAELGAVLLEKCTKMYLERATFTPVGGFEPSPVTRENFSAFRALHDRVNPDMYWTGERIEKDLSHWHILTHGGSYVMLSLWGETPEVFALRAESAEDVATLLSAVAMFAFEAGKSGVLFMTDDCIPLEAEAAGSIGFKTRGNYSAYRCRIPVLLNND